MRFLRRLLGAALLGAGVVYLRGRRKALAMARGAEASLDDQFGTSAPVAGEGIDHVRDLAAHEDIKAVRDRLPRR